jgi:hypothetical protein
MGCELHITGDVGIPELHIPDDGMPGLHITGDVEMPEFNINCLRNGVKKKGIATFELRGA